MHANSVLRGDMVSDCIKFREVLPPNDRRNYWVLVLQVVGLWM